MQQIIFSLPLQKKRKGKKLFLLSLINIKFALPHYALFYQFVLFLSPRRFLYCLFVQHFPLFFQAFFAQLCDVRYDVPNLCRLLWFSFVCQLNYLIDFLFIYLIKNKKKKSRQCFLFGLIKSELLLAAIKKCLKKMKFLQSVPHLTVITIKLC